jgi:hypothetical protein
MVHECRIQCYAYDKDTSELAGIDDPGKWMPFIFDMWIVKAAKLASDEADHPAFNCTTIYCNSGETYIIDTPYTEFFDKFIKYLNSLNIDFKEDDLDVDL